MRGRKYGIQHLSLFSVIIAFRTKLECARMATAEKKSYPTFREVQDRTSSDFPLSKMLVYQGNTLLDEKFTE